MKLYTTKILWISFSGVLFFSSCKKDDTQPQTSAPNNPVTPSYTIPTTYTFSNAVYVESVQRLAMLGEMSTYIRSTHTSTAATQPTLDVQKLINMYTNTGSAFNDAALNASGIQLKDKTINTFNLQSSLETVFQEAQDASVFSAANATLNTASKGTAGKIISPSRAILVDANGFEFKELVEKGIMGAVFYAQATSILNKIQDFDNSTSVNGSTAQEKAWDEAFGYFGVPQTFPTSTVGLKYWGSYGNSVNAAINCNTTIMNAFLKGRAAIVNKDNDGRNSAAKTVMNTWEKIGAAKCINYLKTAKANMSDMGTFLHTLTEGYGFVMAMKYNPAKLISDADLSALNAYFGSGLYDMSQAGIDNAIAKLAAVYGLDATKL